MASAWPVLLLLTASVTLAGGGAARAESVTRPAGVRLAFIELQAGGRSTPSSPRRRLIFAVPPLSGLQEPLFDLLLSRALLGACIDRSVLGRAGLGTRPLRREVAFPAASALATAGPDGGSQTASEWWAPRLAAPEPQWESLRHATLAREAGSPVDDAGNATQPAMMLFFHLRSAEGGLAGASVAHANLSASELDEARPGVGIGALIAGHRELADLQHSLLSRRSTKPCGAHIAETGELIVPADPVDPSSKPRSFASLLPSREELEDEPRLALPLGRPITTHHVFSPASAADWRKAAPDALHAQADSDVYQFQVATAGVPRGQKLLLGVLAHDNGQPALLLSYTTAKGSFEEAHWALPVECGSDICSYQRLVVEASARAPRRGGAPPPPRAPDDRPRPAPQETHAAPLLLSLRSVSMSHSSDRLRFTVHSQPLVVTRLKPGEPRRVTVEGGAPPRTAATAAASVEHMLPTMYFYSVRVPALHELLLRVEASQPVLLTASTEGLVSLVSSSPRLLAEGFPGTPAELLMRSTESEHTVHVGITLLSPPDGFEISAALEEAPVPPPQDISELAMELEATGVLDGLTSSERASIIQQVHAEEVALGHLSLPQLAPQLRAEMQRGERLPSLSFSRHEEDGGGLFGVNSLLLLAIVLLVAGSVLLATLHFMVKVDNEVAAATASSLYPQYVKRKDGRSRGSQKGGGVGGASAGKHAATLPAALSSPVASGKAELRRRRGTEPNGNAARAAAGAAAEAAAGQRKGGKPAKDKGGAAPAPAPAPAASTGAARPDKAGTKKEKASRAAPPASAPPAPKADKAASKAEARLPAASPVASAAEGSNAGVAPKRRGGGGGGGGGGSSSNIPTPAVSEAPANSCRSEVSTSGGRGDSRPLSTDRERERNRRGAAAAAGGNGQHDAGARPAELGPRVWVAPLTAAALDHERELRASFSQWGVVSAVKVKVEGSRASPGYGFVYFKEEAAVRALLAHIDAGGDPPAFLGRSLLVREAVYKTTPQPSDAPASGPTKPDAASPASSRASADRAAPAAAPDGAARRGGSSWSDCVRSSGSSAPALSSLPRLAVGDGVANGGPTAHAANPWEAGVAAGGLPRPHGCADRLPGALPSAVRANPLDDLLDPFVATGGAQPSFDELGSSMLRELLDSPSPPLLPMQQQTAPPARVRASPPLRPTARRPPRGPCQPRPRPPPGRASPLTRACLAHPPCQVRAASWGDSPAASPWSPPAPFVGGAAAFGHADPLGHPRGQDMATGLPPLGVPSPAGASGTSCSPWWQSGGNLSLGGLPAPALADWGGFGLTSGGAVDDDSKRRVGLGATGSA